jgi:hypothetical protein
MLLPLSTLTSESSKPRAFFWLGVALHLHAAMVAPAVYHGQNFPVGLTEDGTSASTSLLACQCQCYPLLRCSFFSGDKVPNPKRRGTASSRQAVPSTGLSARRPTAFWTEQCDAKVFRVTQLFAIDGRQGNSFLDGEHRNAASTASLTPYRE